MTTSPAFKTKKNYIHKNNTIIYICKLLTQHNRSFPHLPPVLPQSSLAKQHSNISAHSCLNSTLCSRSGMAVISFYIPVVTQQLSKAVILASTQTLRWRLFSSLLRNFLLALIYLFSFFYSIISCITTSMIIICSCTKYTQNNAYLFSYQFSKPFFVLTQCEYEVLNQRGITKYCFKYTSLHESANQ